jgi:pimeloyl-ACP methyl ester carboxylesterase
MAYGDGMASDFVLLAGLWLPNSVWNLVASELGRADHRPVTPALPGVDDGWTHAGLDDQLAAALAAVDSTTRPVVVGHSAAATLAWMVADRRPEQVRRIVLIGGFPAADGDRYADLFPMRGRVMPFPGWEPFEGPDARDLDEPTRTAVAAAAVPVPEGVAHGTVRLQDPRRCRVPVTVICPEFSPDDARGWVTDGQVPELAAATRVSYVDIDSGHWPMLTRPADLALILDAVTKED